MPTLEEVLAYLGYDAAHVDDLILLNANRAMATARQTVLGGVGADVETYLPDDPRVKELVLIYTDDLYSERGVAAKVSNAIRRSVADMEQQLRLELARARKAGVTA